MVRIVDGLLIIKIETGENPNDPNDATPFLLRRFEKVIEQNALLMAEMEKMKERERKMSLMFPG